MSTALALIGAEAKRLASVLAGASVITNNRTGYTARFVNLTEREQSDITSLLRSLSGNIVKPWSGADEIFRVGHVDGYASLDYYGEDYGFYAIKRRKPEGAGLFPCRLSLLPLLEQSPTSSGEADEC